MVGRPVSRRRGRSRRLAGAFHVGSGKLLPEEREGERWRSKEAAQVSFVRERGREREGGRGVKQEDGRKESDQWERKK
jgi:hypothetical protein